MSAPVQDIRVGRIKAAVFENDTEAGTRYNVALKRLYKEGDQWKEATTFGEADLPLVAKLSDLVHAWIQTKAAKEGS